MMRRILFLAAFAWAVTAAGASWSQYGGSGGSIPAGSNNIGGVELIDSGGTNKAGINASGQVSTTDSANAAFQGAVAMTNGTTGYTAARSIGFNCTAAGNVIITALHRPGPLHRLEETAGTCTVLDVEASAVLQPATN